MLALAAPAPASAKFYTAPQGSSVFIVEGVECRQADIGNFLFA